MRVVRAVKNSLMFSILLIHAVSQPVFSQEDADLLAEEAQLLAEIKNQIISNTTGQSINNNESQITKSEATKKETISNPNAKSKNEELVEIDFNDNNKARAAIKTDSVKPVSKFENKTADSNKSIKAAGSVLEDENSTLKSTLSQQSALIEQLKSKLAKQRDDLLMAETEIDRLSKLMNVKRQATLEATTGVKLVEEKTTAPAKVVYVSQDARKAAVAPAQAEKMTSDMTIATVTSNKANLRTGPGKNNSPLMAVSKGTRLAVELRQGDWYRVISPTGMRAWVSAEVVSFGRDRFSEPSRTLKVKGYSSGTEEEAFKLIKQNMR